MEQENFNCAITVEDRMNVSRVDDNMVNIEIFNKESINGTTSVFLDRSDVQRLSDACLEFLSE